MDIKAVIAEINKKRGIPKSDLEKLSLFDLNRMYEKMLHKEKNKAKFDLYMKIRCAQTFYNKKTYRQECRLTGKECKFSVDSVQDTICKNYEVRK